MNFDENIFSDEKSSVGEMLGEPGATKLLFPISLSRITDYAIDDFFVAQTLLLAYQEKMEMKKKSYINQPDPIIMISILCYGCY